MAILRKINRDTLVTFAFIGFWTFIIVATR